MRYQRTPLDGRFHDSSDMLQLLASYQDQLKTAGLEGLGVRPIPHPSGRTFVEEVLTPEQAVHVNAIPELQRDALMETIEVRRE